MSRMFYSLPEAAARLGKSEDDVRAMIDSGTLQEFRDGEQVMLKVEQVDLLAGDDDEGGDEMIPLADSSELEPIGLSSSGSGSVFGVDESGDQTGISIFDPEGEEEVDPSAATQVTGSMPTVADFGSPSASGSGLANVAASDDTSLGSDLLEDVYGGAGESGAPADLAGASAVIDTGGDLFETPAGGGGDEDLAPAGMGVVGPAAMATPYEPGWSGLLGGAAFAMTILLLVAMTIAVLAMTGGGAEVFSQIDSTMILIIAGGGLGLVGLSAGIGYLLLRKG